MEFEDPHSERESKFYAIPVSGQRGDNLSPQTTDSFLHRHPHLAANVSSEWYAYSDIRSSLYYQIPKIKADNTWNSPVLLLFWARLRITKDDTDWDRQNYKYLFDSIKPRFIFHIFCTSDTQTFIISEIGNFPIICTVFRTKILFTAVEKQNQTDARKMVSCVLLPTPVSVRWAAHDCQRQLGLSFPPVLSVDERLPQ